MVKKVGADDFLAKFRPDDLASRVVDRIKAADHGWGFPRRSHDLEAVSLSTGNLDFEQFRVFLESLWHIAR